MKIGSLFSGIGGLELGLERAIPDARVIWQVEQSPYARRVLAKHWPEARRYEDVKEVGAHNLEPVDIICGGFPCQDISLAGSGAGIEGERSGLWFEFARIIGELRPQYAVLENVSAIRARGLGQVLGSLAESGYDAIWDCIPAAAVSAPHRRDRWFCIAFKPLANSDRERLQGHRQAGNVGKVCPQEKAGLFRSSLRHLAEWKPEPSLGRVAHGVPDRVHRLKCLGNAVVPQVAEVVGRVVVELGGLR